VLGSAIATVFGAVIAALGDRSAGAKSRAAAAPPVGRSILLRYGAPAAISSVVITGLSIADRYVVRSLLGLESVGLYGASYDVAEKTIFFANSMLLLSSSVVGFQVFEAEGEERAAQFLSRLMWLYLVVVVPTAGLMIAHADLIIESLLGPGFREGAAVFGIVTASGVLVGIMHRYSLLLSFHKRTDAILYCSLVALAMNIVACLVLIPRYGLTGAAVATFIGYFTWLVTIRMAASRYLVPRFPIASFGRIVVITIAAAAASILLGRTVPARNFGALALVGAAGAVIYAAMIFAIGEVRVAQIVSYFRRGGVAEPSR
jgi:O-antigen/teichoic acid export membrane protein